jgi:hypothetical protein
MNGAARAGLYLPDDLSGITWEGNVFPAGGEWAILQLSLPNARYLDSFTKTWMRQRGQGWGLDQQFPYGGVAKWPTATAFPNGQGDRPSDGLSGKLDETESAGFQTFQMYLPPSGQEASRWVALRQITWSYSVHVTFDGQAWAVDRANTTQDHKDLSGTPDEPTWDQVWTKAALADFVAE